MSVERRKFVAYILSDGADSMAHHQPANLETGFTLQELYSIVMPDQERQMIEVVYLSNGRLMVIDEEGKLNGATINHQATRYAHQHGLPHDDFIVGKALVCSRKEIQ